MRNRVTPEGSEPLEYHALAQPRHRRTSHHRVRVDRDACVGGKFAVPFEYSSGPDGDVAAARRSGEWSVSWRSSAEWELRARVSPELLAGALAIVLVVALIGILGLAQPDGTGPAPAGSTAEPTASANRDPTTTVDTTSMRSVLSLLDQELASSRTGEPRRSQERYGVVIRRNGSSALAMPSFRLTAGS